MIHFKVQLLTYNNEIVKEMNMHAQTIEIMKTRALYHLQQDPKAGIAKVYYSDGRLAFTTTLGAK